MEIKKLIILGCVSFHAILVSAQINVSLEYDCVEQNTLIMGKALIESEDRGFVSNLLENKINFLFLMNVDSLGHVVSIEKIRSKKEVPVGFKERIESYLKANKIPFYICFDLPESTSKEYMYKLITKDLFKNKDTHLVNAPFPGNVMKMYNEDKFSSKYDYLKSYIGERFSGKKNCCTKNHK